MKKLNRIRKNGRIGDRTPQSNSVRAFRCAEVKVVTVRAQRLPSRTGGVFDSRKDVHDLWSRAVASSRWFDQDKEHLVCICLDVRFKLKGYSLVSIGSLNEVIAHPREVFRPAIVSSSHSIIVAHNHPSGDPSASALDLDVTCRLHSAGELLQIPLLDHVIVARRKSFSVREHSRSWPPRGLKARRSRNFSFDHL
jgi:DNA repair protein RadC